MICKWCGASVNAADKKCGRCGREIPALSDCGGFYNVAPKAPRPEAAPKPAAAPVQPAAPVVKEPEKKSSSAPLIVVAVLVVIALVIGQVLLMMRIADLEETVQGLSAEMGELRENQAVKVPVDPDDDPDDDKSDHATKGPDCNDKVEPTAPTDSQPTESQDSEDKKDSDGGFLGWVLNDDLGDDQSQTVQLMMDQLGPVELARSYDAPAGVITYSLANDPDTRPDESENVIKIQFRYIGTGAYAITCGIKGDAFDDILDDVAADITCDGQTWKAEVTTEKRDGMHCVDIDVQIAEDKIGKEVDLTIRMLCEYLDEPIDLVLSGVETLEVQEA